MAFRKCPVHGWLETAHYAPDEMGELRCKECDRVVTEFRDDSNPPRGATY